MMTRTSEIAGYRQISWRLLVSLCVLLFAAYNVQAMPRVSIWGAPATILPELRLAKPNLDWQLESANSDVQLHIAWHAEAYERLQQPPQRSPILLISASLSRRPLARTQDAALLWGPPLLQQVRLARRVMPLAKRIGILIRRQPNPEVMQSLEHDIEQIAMSMKADGVTVVPLMMQAPMSARAIAEAAERVDIFVASNDEVLFNRDTAKLILLTAYRHQRALIGPSPAFVTAGAVATLAAPKSALLSVLLNHVERWQKSGRLGDSSAVDTFRPVLNPQVARSLGLYLAPDLMREAQP